MKTYQKNQYEFWWDYNRREWVLYPVDKFGLRIEWDEHDNPIEARQFSNKEHLHQYIANQGTETVEHRIKMAKNIKTVKITIPNEAVLKKVNSTPALSRLSRLKLVVGENIENVNHAQFAEQMRMFPIAGCEIEEIIKDEQNIERTFKYKMWNQPCGVGCQPDRYINYTEMDYAKTGFYGELTYDRRLTDVQIFRFRLTPSDVLDSNLPMGEDGMIGTQAQELKTRLKEDAENALGLKNSEAKGTVIFKKRDDVERSEKIILGFTEEVTDCGCCGRSDLKGTYAIQYEDEILYYGSVCAFKVHNVSYEEQAQVKYVYKRRMKAAEKFKKMEEEYNGTEYALVKMYRFVEEKKLDVMAFLNKYADIEETEFYTLYKIGSVAKVIDK